MEFEIKKINYKYLIESALMRVVKRALEFVAKNGGGNNSLYLSFNTSLKGVVIPDFLRAKYSEGMTIVLENEFSDLTIGVESFGVTLFFEGSPYNIVVPYASIVRFADPRQDVSFEFSSLGIFSEKGFDDELFNGSSEDSAIKGLKNKKFSKKVVKEGDDNLVSLEDFRKK